MNPSKPSLAVMSMWAGSIVLAAGGGWWFGRQSLPRGAPATTSAWAVPVASPSGPEAPSTPGSEGWSEVRTESAMPARGVEAARAALTQTNASRRKRAFFAFLDTMTAEQAPEVERIIFELNRQGIDLPEEWYAFIGRWGEVDAPAALAFMQGKRDAGEFEGMIQSSEAIIFGAWASEDAAAARHWLEAQPEGSQTESLWASLIQGMASQDLAAATALAVEKTTPEEPGHKRAMEQMAEIAVRQGGVEGMHSWFEALPESSKRDASSHVHWRNMQASMEMGAAWLSEQADTPWRKDRQIQELADRWKEQDPAAATQWTASLPPGTPGLDAYTGLHASLSAWIAKSPDDVAAWVASLQNAPPYDAALAGVALHYYRQAGDPSTGERWLSSIRSPEIREAVRQAVAAPADR